MTTIKQQKSRKSWSQVHTLHARLYIFINGARIFVANRYQQAFIKITRQKIAAVVQQREECYIGLHVALYGTSVFYMESMQESSVLDEAWTLQL